MVSKYISAGIAIAILSGSSLVGASLKEEAKDAWEVHLQERMAAMQARLQPGSHFLWLDEEPGRMEHVRTKEAYILPMGERIPKPVPSGLIHDWLGAGFLENTTIADVLKVLRDYDHYAEMYRPGVVASKLNRTEGATDFFLLRFVNKSVVAKTALDSEGEASWVQVDEHRWYGYSKSSHIIEVDKPNTAEEHSLPEDHGTGLIWRLASVVRLEERDGGVYMELEAFALSRDIPAAFRLIAGPIVRRVSRDSMATSLHQTKVALDKQREGIRRNSLAAQ
jgi:hypothetical protein